MRTSEEIRNDIDTLREELTEAYKAESGMARHASDCATSVAPAEEPGPCDCGERGCGSGRLYEFQYVTRPVVDYLRAHWHPHAVVLITPQGAELLSGELGDPIPADGIPGKVQPIRS